MRDAGSRLVEEHERIVRIFAASGVDRAYEKSIAERQEVHPGQRFTQARVLN